ncbi:MAG: hypothetical protein KGI52_01865 [Burkholderiales bacterium]|nr:hypothetical protein [Burkholderiales bacterium]
MTVETALYPSQFNTNWPTAADMVSEGDNHLRLIKIVDKTTWPNVAGAVSASHIELNYLVGVTSGIQAQLNTKGAIAGQTWTGTHVFPSTTTVGPLTPTTQGYLSTVTSDAQAQINSKGAIAGQTWTGTHVFPSTTTVGPLTPTIQTWLSGVTSDVQIQINAKSTKTGDTYSGAHNFTGATVTVPTATAGDATNAAASTAFVSTTAFNSALPGQTGNAEKFTHTGGTAADWQFPVLLPVPVAVNTTMVAGRKYIATAAGITLTFPASMTARDPIEVMNASSGDISVDFNGHTVKNQTPDSPMLVPTLRGFQVTYTGSTLA